jgi:hypothetical protein
MPQRQQWRPDHGNGMGAHGATAMPHHHSVSGDPSMIHSCMHAYECVARRSAGAQREIEIGPSIPPGGLSLVASRMRTNGGAYAWPPPVQALRHTKLIAFLSTHSAIIENWGSIDRPGSMYTVGGGMQGGSLCPTSVSGMRRQRHLRFRSRSPLLLPVPGPLFLGAIQRPAPDPSFPLVLTSWRVYY